MSPVDNSGYILLWRKESIDQGVWERRWVGGLGLVEGWMEFCFLLSVFGFCFSGLVGEWVSG